MHYKKMFKFENGQVHGIQHSQWSHSIANINLFKSHASFSQALFSRYSHLKIHDLESLGQAHDVNIRSCAIRRQISDFLLDGNSNDCIFPTFTCQNNHLNSYTLTI